MIVPFTATDAHERPRPARRHPGSQGRRLDGDRLGRRDSRRDPARTRRDRHPHRASRAAPRSSSPRATRRAKARVLGVIHLKDIVKEGLRERFAELRAMGIRTVMITGDNPLTAKAIAAEAGVDDFLAEATPEDKMALIRREQEGGNLVAMTGRRHERRPRPRPGRRRRRDEHRHLGREGGRQHGRPRLRPDQAHRHRAHRQAAAHHPRRPHDVLDRERRREVLRDHPGDVRRGLPRARGAERHAAALAGVGDHVARSSSTRSSSSCSSRSPCAGVDVPPGGREPHPEPQPADLRARRHHRPVHRHQAHRPRRVASSPASKEQPHHETTRSSAAPDLDRPPRHADLHRRPRRRLPRRWSPGSASSPFPGRRTARS